jgi:hypothetical protein
MMAHSGRMIAKKLRRRSWPRLRWPREATGLNPNREMADQPGAIQMPAGVQAGALAGIEALRARLQVS